jgi:hypothetical protein
MKNEIIMNLDTLPTTTEDVKEVLQELWNDVSPEDRRYLTYRHTYKI